nr:YdaU family protein [uncultured Pseudomonas sp.]
MHYFKRNIGDYHKKAGRLSMVEHGAYTLLLDACYDRERFPTMEEAIDWCWARSPEEISAVTFVLSKFFELVGGRYVQARIQDEVNAYHAMALKNREIAEKREADKRTKRAGDSTKRAPVVNESPPNQEPLTTNQGPKDQHHSLNAGEEIPQIEFEPEPAPEPVNPKAPVEMTLDWTPDTNLLKTYCVHFGVSTDLFTREAVAPFTAHHETAGNLNTQSKWVSLLVKWVKDDKNRASNVRQFVKRETPSRHTGFAERDYTADLIQREDGTYAL